MQTKSTSHGKEINLTSGNMTIKSTNFSVDKNGNITAKGGTIGGFTLGANKFSTTINGIYDFNIYDARNILSTQVEYINLTSITSSLYDLNGDGEVDVFDGQRVLKILEGTQTNTKNVSGTFEINTNNPKNFITIKSGSNLAVSIGLGGINTHLLSAEAIVCSTQNGSGSFSGVAINGRTGTIAAKSYDNASLESIKKNITKFDNALDIIKNSEIYEYNFKTEEDTDKKHVGFVIGEKYNTPSIVKSNDGKAIESYTMSAIEWRALQEIIKRLETVERKVN